MSDSVRPHRWQPIKLLCPWDSPDKSGVGCHFLLQHVEVKRESEVVQSCLTFHDPMDCSLPGSSIHGIFKARVLEWLAIAFSVRVDNTYEKHQRASLVAQRLKRLPAMWVTWVRSLGWEDPLERER